MPFKSKAQAKYMYAKHPQMANEFAEKTPSMAKLPEKVEDKPKHAGKGTRARLDTSAERNFFNPRYKK